MKTAPLFARESGHAMLIALVLLAVVTGLVGIAVQRTGGSARFSARANDFSEVERAADGLIEYAYGTWKKQTLQVGTALGLNFDNNGNATGYDTNEINTSTKGLIGLTPVDKIPTGFTTLPANDPDGDGTWKITLVDYMGVPVVNPPGRLLVNLPDYPGWKGYAYTYLASVRLRTSTGINADQSKRASAGARRLFQYIEVPLFQAMYFFEDQLEIYRPAPMIVSGLVHTNSRLLLSGSSDQSGVELNFQGNVSYAGGSTTNPGYTASEIPVGGTTWSGKGTSAMEAPTFSNGGEAAQLAKVSRYEPLGNKPAAVLDAPPSNPLWPDGDSDGNPNNDSFHELIEPPTSGFTDPVEISKRRLFNKAGVVVRVNGSTVTDANRNTVVTVTAGNGTTLTAAQITEIKGAISKNSFYDEREAKMVDVVNMDMGKMTTQLNSATGFNGVLYVYDATPSSSGDTEPKTVRLWKGGTLPNTGLTVASQNPVYVLGDYNTGTTYPSGYSLTSGVPNSTSVPSNDGGNPNNTESPTVTNYTRKPSAVIADAVMFLSNSWKDSNSANSSSDLGDRVATHTTYNTAIMSGFLPSGFDPDGGGSGAAYGYGGGANNFPRFLENWADKSCTYFGSMVELFQSKTFTGKWWTGDIYSPPNRRWNYDTIFSSTPPPGSVDAVVIVRGTWARL